MIYGYVEICRIFGFQFEQNDLYKDEIFSKVTEMIFEKKYQEVIQRTQRINLIKTQKRFREKIQTEKITWMDLNTVTRIKYSIEL